MNVAFRVDASLKIGTGHVMRCLTLADALREQGIESLFLSRDHVGHLHQVVMDRGYPLVNLGSADAANVQEGVADYASWLGVDVQRDADDSRAALVAGAIDWVVVDHYGLDARWERALRSACDRIMAVDDLANRNHVVDALLDQTLDRTAAAYEAKVPASCKLMLGSHYALVRPEFSALRTESLSRRSQGRIRKVLITMGGVDLVDATGAILDALQAWRPPSEVSVSVVMGPNAPWRDKVMQQAQRLSFSTDVLVDVRNMSTLMHDADLAIGAAGSTSWERCCLGLPSLQLVLAENQRAIARALSRAGAALLLDRSKLESDLRNALTQLFRDPSQLVRMSAAAAAVVDGLGAARVAQHFKSGLFA